MKTVKIIVQGYVQGVFYRASAKDMARSLRLCGTVRNLPDASVELVISGDDNQVDEMIQWAQYGPPKAEVEKVSVTDMPVLQFEEFSIVRD